MKYKTGHNTQQILERLDYTNLPNPKPTDFVPPPRCSLDFYIELDDGTILDDQVFRIQQFGGHENLSQMFEFNATLHANTFTSSGQNQPWGTLIAGAGDYGSLLQEGGPTSQKIDFNKILGAKACIRMGLPETTKDELEGEYPEDRPVVFYNGIISNFSMAERGVYQASIKPALFKLTLQNNYRLFSQKTILEVIIEVLSENNISFNKMELEAAPNKIIRGLANYRKQDWLQAGETDMDFLNRLMHKVHLFYYFTHSNDKHTMIITDQPYYQNIYRREVGDSGRFEETEDLKPMYLSFNKQQTLDRDDYITQFNYQQNLTTSGITTVLAQKEANWESQKTAQTSPIYLDFMNTTEKLNMEMLHIVQYGATEKEMEHLAHTNMNILTASRFSFSGSSTCNEFKPGYKFLLKQRDGKGSGYNDVPIFPTLEDQEFVVTSVQHHGTAEGEYNNQFQAADARGLAMPFSSQTGNMGSILAKVIDNSAAKAAQAAEEDYEGSVDVIKQQGSPEKYLKKDVFSFDSKDFYYDDTQESYKCKGIFVRFIDQPEDVPPTWVKLAEHMQTIPEVDTFVTVGRSSDDNEIPEVQQSLQAKGSKVIMPEDYTCHTSVGNNYNTNYGDSTSISFGWDVSRPLSFAKNIVEAERKTSNYNGVSYSESSNYSYSVTKRSHNISRTGDGPDQPFNPSDMMSYVSYGNQTTYGDTYNKSVHTGNSNMYNTQTGHSYSESNQTGGSTSVQNIDWTDSTSTIGSSSSMSTIGSSDNTSLVGTSSNISITGQQTGINVTGIAGNVSTTGVSVSANLTGMTMNSSMTGMSINTNMLGLSVDMSMIGLTSSTSEIGTTNSTSMIGVSNSTNMVGVSNNTSLTGAAISTGLTGASSSTNLTGSSDSTNLTGSSVSTNLTGSNTSTNITGSSTDTSITGSSNSISITGGGSYISLNAAVNLLTTEMENEIIAVMRSVL